MQIFIRRLTRQTITLDVEASDSTDTVLATIAKIEGCPVEQFRLEAYGPVEQFNLDSMPYPWIVPLDDGCRTMSDYGIREGEWLRLEQHFEIVIVTLAGKMFTVEVEASWDIGTVKSQLYYQNGKLKILDCKFTELVVGTTLMDRKKCVVDYGLKQGSRVQCLLSHAPYCKDAEAK